MNLTFYGATREVTGSMHMISTQDDQILLDCGMFQGRRKETQIKNQSFAFDPRMISNMVLSHAHIDHSGRIPLLVKNQFAGRIICTNATKDACRYLLLDSAHIQESDAEYLNYKAARGMLNRVEYTNKEKRDIKKALKKEGHRLNTDAINEVMEEYHLEKVSPLYSMKDAENALNHIEGVPYGQSVDIGKHISCTQYDAGHILGSSISVVRYKPKNRQFTVCFTGDIGRFDKPIIKDPNLFFNEEDRDIDLLVMESTYGNRFHEPAKDTKGELQAVIERSVSRGGIILIPAFSYGRTQEILYLLHELYNENAVPKIPVYVDSPLSSKITRVFGEHPEVYDRETHETFLSNGQNPFSFKQLKFIESVEESMALNREKSPHIVIASSGMCEAGRILHHLRYKIHNPKTTILIVGFMAEHTLGRRILEKGKEFNDNGRKGNAPTQKILNKEYPLYAHVEMISGFSAHGDQSELFRFLKESNLNVKRIAVVHGEEEQSMQFADKLNESGYQAFVPFSGQMVRV